MANLYGTVQGFGKDGRANASKNTRVGHSELVTTAQTWKGQVTVRMEADGSFAVYVGDKDDPGVLVMTGLANAGERAIEFHEAEGELDV